MQLAELIVAPSDEDPVTTVRRVLTESSMDVNVTDEVGESPEHVLLSIVVTGLGNLIRRPSSIVVTGLGNLIRRPSGGLCTVWVPLKIWSPTLEQSLRMSTKHESFLSEMRYLYIHTCAF